MDPPSPPLPRERVTLTIPYERSTSRFVLLVCYFCFEQTIAFDGRTSPVSRRAVTRALPLHWAPRRSARAERGRCVVPREGAVAVPVRPDRLHDGDGASSSSGAQMPKAPLCLVQERGLWKVPSRVRLGVLLLRGEPAPAVCLDALQTHDWPAKPARIAIHLRGFRRTRFPTGDGMTGRPRRHRPQAARLIRGCDRRRRRRKAGAKSELGGGGVHDVVSVGSV